MRRLLLVWAGQTASATGSALTAFGLGLWVLQQAGSVFGYSLVIVLSVLPSMLLAPLAGSIADRIDARRLMLASEVGGAGVAALMLFLLGNGELSIGWVYALATMGSVLQAFQAIGYQVAVSRAVPRETLSRANGLVQFSAALSQGSS